MVEKYPVSCPIDESLKALPYYLETVQGKHWPNRLTNAAGRIQLIRGIHGATVSCDRDRGHIKDCLLDSEEISLSLFSQLIEDGIVKNVPKFIKAFRTLPFGTHMLRSGAALVASPFDIYDTVTAIIDLHNCIKDSTECKDAIAGITFSSAYLTSGIVFTAMSAPGIGTLAGFLIMITQGAYSGGRAIEEFAAYKLTFDESFRLFWNTFALQPVPQKGTCSICLEKTRHWLPCGHYFHLNCIAQWLHTAMSCPNCRHLPLE